VTTTLFDPDATSEPVHAPDAVHELALVDDHVRVTDPPVGTLATELDSVAVGGGAMEVDEPLPPPQARRAHAMTKASEAMRKVPVMERILS